jgi:hypothetical protein
MSVPIAPAVLKGAEQLIHQAEQTVARVAEEIAGKLHIVHRSDAAPKGMPEEKDEVVYRLGVDVGGTNTYALLPPCYLQPAL